MLTKCAKLFALLLVNLMWAAQYPAYKIASEQMDLWTLNFWSLLIATVLLTPFLLVFRLRERRARANPRSAIFRYLMLGMFGIIPPSVFMSWGIAHSSASNAAIISLTIPPLMVLFAAILLREQMTGLRWLSMAAALLGTILLSGVQTGGSLFDARTLVGNLVIFAAGAGSAFYNTYSKKLLEAFSELEVLVYGYIVATCFCGALSIAAGRPFYAPGKVEVTGWVSVAVLGAISWGLAMVLWMWALKRLAASQASVSIYLLPLFGLILSALTLHEKLTRMQIVGGVLVLLATYITTIYGETGTASGAAAADASSSLTASPAGKGASTRS